MSLDTLDIANLAASFGTQAITRVKDDAARSLARAVAGTRKSAAAADKLAAAERAAAAHNGYTAAETARIDTLMTHIWPRARVIRDRMRQADAMAREAHMKHDAAALYDAVYRAHRLNRLLTRVNEYAARLGAFGISRDDMRVDRSRFMRSAAWRRFMFRGGRDAVSELWSDEDVLQGAFLRALDAGDANAAGVPMFGTVFRHVQAERAHLTRVAGAEWRGIQSALHGERATESAYPETDDKHVIRLLGTRLPDGRRYGTMDDHRAALAVAHADMEREYAGHVVTREARALAILSAPETSFVRQLAAVLMGGATLEDIADALGLKVSTIRDRVLTDRADMASSGIDHTEDVAPHVAESERNVMLAEEAHGKLLRARENARQRALYLSNRRATWAVFA